MPFVLLLIVSLVALIIAVMLLAEGIEMGWACAAFVVSAIGFGWLGIAISNSPNESSPDAWTIESEAHYILTEVNGTHETKIQVAVGDNGEVINFTKKAEIILPNGPIIMYKMHFRNTYGISWVKEKECWRAEGILEKRP